MSNLGWKECVACGADMPPLNGVEQNDFAVYCEDCVPNGDEYDDEPGGEC